MAIMNLVVFAFTATFISAIYTAAQPTPSPSYIPVIPHLKYGLLPAPGVRHKDDREDSPTDITKDTTNQPIQPTQIPQILSNIGNGRPSTSNEKDTTNQPIQPTQIPQILSNIGNGRPSTSNEKDSTSHPIQTVHIPQFLNPVSNIENGRPSPCNKKDSISHPIQTVQFPQIPNLLSSVDNGRPNDITKDTTSHPIPLIQIPQPLNPISNVNNGRPSLSGGDSSPTIILPHNTQVDIRNPDGQFSHGFSDKDGTIVSEQGKLITTNGGWEYVIAKTGSYSYNSPEGIPVHVEYVADENGFRAIGTHIPK